MGNPSKISFVEGFQITFEKTGRLEKIPFWRSAVSVFFVYFRVGPFPFPWHPYSLGVIIHPYRNFFIRVKPKLFETNN